MCRYRIAMLMLVILGAYWVAGCREDGDIQISGLDFNGVAQVDKGALTSALQTKKGSWIPWGRKRYFDRRAFEADLKRIEAFYRDEGFFSASASYEILPMSKGRVHLRFGVDEGPPAIIRSVLPTTSS